MYRISTLDKRTVLQLVILEGGETRCSLLLIILDLDDFQNNERDFYGMVVLFTF